MNVKTYLSPPAKWQAAPDPVFAPRSPVRHVLVTAAEVGMRLDRFLRHHFPGVPLSFLQRLLRTGQVRVNKGRAHGNLRLVKDDEIRLPPVRPATPEDTKYPPEHLIRAVQNRIVWQDQHLLVLNKPEGIAVHGGSGDPWGVVDAMRRLMELQAQAPPDQASNQPFPTTARPELCHRLDKGTSGCLLFAMHSDALRQMAAAFRQGTVAKKYLALVRGHPQPETGIIDLPLTKGVVRSGERVVVSARHGSPARTHYQVVNRFAHASLLQLTLESGRTHQIRVHLQAIGHPVAGDQKYGDPTFNDSMRKVGLQRLFLHAHRLAFLHPMTGVQMALEAPLDAKLLEILHTQDNLGDPPTILRTFSGPHRGP